MIAKQTHKNTIFVGQENMNHVSAVVGVAEKNGLIRMRHNPLRNSSSVKEVEWDNNGNDSGDGNSSKMTRIGRSRSGKHRGYSSDDGN